MHIYGKHTVSEGVDHRPDVFKRVFFANPKEHAALRKKVASEGIAVGILNPADLPRGVRDTDVHQGVVAEIDERKLLISYKKFIEGVEPDADTALVVFGEVQDPQNVGAVIRSAAAFGVSGVLIPEHNQAPVTATVLKVSAGMAFRVPLVSIGNVNSTLIDLKEKKFWIYGLEGAEGKNIAEETFDAPSVFVLGNEATGLRAKTKEHCDFLVSIPVDPRCESLNAATSMAVALYEWSRSR